MVNGIVFPYPLEIKEISKNTPAGKEMFIRDVEEILKENLQSHERFGCRINDCHTKVGSKVHLKTFTEAELLFHNGYYTRNFALLTANKIVEINENKYKNKYKKVLLIGYETFSELFIRETCWLLSKVKTAESDEELLKAEFVIYTTDESRKSLFRYDNKNEIDHISDWDEWLAVVIVPINTTLTTHDKILGAFYEKFKPNNNVDILNIALIIIGMKENNYWYPNHAENILISKKPKKLVRLSDKPVYYFASVSDKKIEWKDVRTCDNCFPDLRTNAKDLTHEEVEFGVSTESIVPMLQLSELKPVVTYDSKTNEQSESNLEIVRRLQDSLIHRHVVRNDCHHQYYIDTEKFFSREQKEPTDKFRLWLDNVKNRLLDNDDSVMSKRKQFYFADTDIDSIRTIHFIISPRHFSNAGLIQRVNEDVFKGDARIVYFDARNDYRSNVLSKYSNIRMLIENIRNSKQKSLIMFHYVDDTIYTGSTFNRCKSIWQSVVQEDPKVSLPGDDKHPSKTCYVDIFSSIIILLGRMSDSSKQGYIEDASRFFEYVHLSISPLRSYDDACPLCKVKQNYEHMKDHYVTTSAVYEKCKEFIKNHEAAGPFDENYPPTTAEHGYRMLISHLLKELISGKIYLKQIELKFEGKRKNVWVYCAINAENKEEIYECLKFLFAGKSEHNDGVKYDERRYKGFLGLNKNDNIPIDMKVALIKVISRPFFSYQLRIIQGAFRFCVEELDNQLSQPVTHDSKVLCRVLMNALADMNANFIVRSSTLNRLFEIAKNTNKKVPNGEIQVSDILYAVKHVTTLSEDDQKSLLLEYILINGDERKFFNDGENPQIIYKELCIPFSERLKLYLENTKVMKDGIEDLFGKSDNETNTINAYYLADFKEFFGINGVPTDVTDRLISEEALLGPLNEIHKLAIQISKPEKKKGNAHKRFREMCEHICEYFNKFKDNEQGFVVKDSTIFFADTNEFPRSVDELEKINTFEKYRRWNKYYTYPDDQKLPDCIDGIEAVLKDYFVPDKNEESSSKDEDKKDEDRNGKKQWDTDNDTILYSGEHIVLKLFGNASSNEKRDCFLIYIKMESPITEVKQLFFVRMLLLLRNDIALLIDDSSISTLLEDEKNRRVRKALSIEKAVNHNDGAFFAYSAKEFCAPQTQPNLNLPTLYFISEANAMIAKLYRIFAQNGGRKVELPDGMMKNKIHSFSHPFEDGFKKVMSKFGFKQEEDLDRYNMEFVTTNNSETKSHVSITIDTNQFEGKSFQFISSQTTLNPLVLLILLLANNAARHSEEAWHCKVDVFYADGLVVSSVCKDRKGDEIRIDGKIEQAKEKCDRPPWSYNKEQSITLWTLDKVLRHINSSNNSGSGKGLEFDDNDGNFIVKLNFK